MVKVLYMMIAGIMLTACATHPERLKVRHPEDPNIYSGLSCEAIDAELAVLYPRMDEKYNRLRDIAVTDEIQMWAVFLGPMILSPLFALSIESGDIPDAAHYRTMRGQETFLHQEWRKKDCLNELARVPTTEELYQEGLEKANKPNSGG